MRARSKAIRARLAGAAVAALAAICALPTSAPADPPTLGCRYVEAGDPGPAGNLLEVDGTGDVAIGRDDQLITVSLASSIGTRIERAIECAGPVPTVTAVDRIVYTAPPDLGQVLIDERGGRFEPGATDEPGGDEIEFSVRLPRPEDENPTIHVLGTPGADMIGAGSLAGGRVGVNLNWVGDLSPKDPDVIVSRPGAAVLKIAGDEGNDRLSGVGGKEFAGPPRSLDGLVMAGGDDDDLLLGGPRGDFLEGDGGNDHVVGRGGGDMLRGGPGRDQVLGQGGDDWIWSTRVSEDDFQLDRLAGGPGDDYISAWRGGRDEVLCGTGLDEARVDPFDVWRRHDCDEVRICQALARHLGSLLTRCRPSRSSSSTSSPSPTRASR